MRAILLTFVLLAVAAVTPMASAGVGNFFSGTGTIVQGVECELFQADSGGLYILSGAGDFSKGDQLFVVGTVDPTCISICQQGNGCLSASTVIPITDDNQIDTCGTVIQGVECLLFAADTGGTYIVGGLGEYSIGDRVNVSGLIDPTCISFCQQGNGCVVNATITDCDDEPLTVCGTLTDFDTGPDFCGQIFEADNGTTYLLFDPNNALKAFMPGEPICVTGNVQSPCFLPAICVAPGVTVCLDVVSAESIDGPEFSACGVIVDPGVPLLNPPLCGKLFETNGGVQLIINGPGVADLEFGDIVCIEGDIEQVCILPAICSFPGASGCVDVSEISEPNFTQCGILTAGVECPGLLIATDQGQFWLGLTTKDIPFNVGDEVQVSGNLALFPPDLTTICQQGQGVIGNAFVQECPGADGDLDGDGDVDGNDLLILLNAWGRVGAAGDSDADLDGDNTVGGNDLLILLNNWG